MLSILKNITEKEQLTKKQKKNQKDNKNKISSRGLFMPTWQLATVIIMTKKRTTFPTATVQRIIKERTGMMVSKELAEYEAEILLRIITKRALKLKAYAEKHKKKIIKKEMAELFDEIEAPY